MDCSDKLFFAFWLTSSLITNFLYMKDDLFHATKQNVKYDCKCVCVKVFVD